MVINLLNGTTLKLETIADRIEHRGLTGSGDVAIRGITYDSRQVRKGALFVALPGHQRDGEAFIDEAIRRGASAVVSRRTDWLERGTPHLCVEDPRRALAELSDVFYEHPSGQLDLVGITGTNGKTTVAFMIRHILQCAGRHPGLIGTVRYEIGNRVIPASRTTPEAPDLQSMLAQMVKTACDSAVMEVSSHALVQQRIRGLAFDVAVFTNLSREHLDYHQTLDAYFEAKASLFTGDAGTTPELAVVNLDDVWGRKLVDLLHAAGVPVLTYSTTGTADLQAVQCVVGEEASTFIVKSSRGDAAVNLPLTGAYNISNALAALGAAVRIGVPLEAAAAALSSLSPVPGRLEPVPNPHGLHVLVDYAHTDDALHHVLNALRGRASGKLLVVFGCGGDRDRTKRPRMGAVAAHLADRVFLTSDNPRSEDPAAILREIAEGIEDPDCFEIIPDREEAIARALGQAVPGDTVLIAGKGHENYQEFQHTVIPFDDRAVAERILGERKTKPS